MSALPKMRSVFRRRGAVGANQKGQQRLPVLRRIVPALLFCAAELATGAPVIGGNFTLSTSDGTQVSEHSYRGKWALIYFGYASCPDICSTVMAQVATALADLGPAAAKLQPLFITLDPVHDKPDQLSRYLSNFDRRIVGLTGTETQTQAAVQSFRMYFKKRMLDDGSSSIDHSSFLFLMKPDGSFARLLSGDTPGHQLADELRRQLL